MLLNTQKIRDMVAREYGAATTEVHAFIDWLDGKDKSLETAKTLLEANGYVVTEKPATTAA